MGSLFKKEKVHCAHILVEDEAKARDLLRQVKAGGDFAALAREHSKCPSGKQNGGDMGFFEKGRMVKPFDDAAFALQPGELSELVQTKYGFHIIKRIE